MDNKLKVEQPFAAGTLGCQRYRIPAILTLNNGEVLAAADLRYNHGADSPHNLDILAAKSQDGYKNWLYTRVNYFDDYSDEVSDRGSASFIDTALVQSRKSDRIFLLTDVWTSNGGYCTAKKGSGYVNVDGKRHLLLTKGSTKDELITFEYYIGNYENGFAKIYNLCDNKATQYSVDEDYILYKNGEVLYQKQVGSQKNIKQTVFYEGADLKLYCTCYLCLRWSDDNGKTWSKPKIISEYVKNDNEAFLGVCPGRGLCIDYNNNERILFCVYDNTLSQERVSTIYSDDNGLTWHRSKATDVRKKVKKTSESQLVLMPNGKVRMFSRNAYDFVAYADSSDGGESFEVFKEDTALSCCKNCMVSFINLNRKIKGKSVVLGSYPYNTFGRKDGMLSVGLVNDDKIEWINFYHVNEGPYAYSCLTELEDSNIGLLYEDSDFSIKYEIFKLDDEGNITSLEREDIDYRGKISPKNKIIKACKALSFKINNVKGLV